MRRAALALLRRETGLIFDGGGGPGVALGFYLGLVVLVPLGGGAEPARLAPLAYGLAVMGLALAGLLSLEGLFARDAEDGSLDGLMLGSLPVEAVCVIKALAHWLSVGLPLALTSPLAAVLLGLSPDLLGLALISSVLATLGFSLTGMMGAALAVGARRSGLLITVVVLPLYVPPVVFAGGALSAAAQGLAPGAALALLAAYGLFALALSPLVAASALRATQE